MFQAQGSNSYVYLRQGVSYLYYRYGSTRNGKKGYFSSFENGKMACNFQILKAFHALLLQTARGFGVSRNPDPFPYTKTTAIRRQKRTEKQKNKNEGRAEENDHATPPPARPPPSMVIRATTALHGMSTAPSPPTRPRLPSPLSPTSPLSKRWLTIGKMGNQRGGLRRLSKIRVRGEGNKTEPLFYDRVYT